MTDEEKELERWREYRRTGILPPYDYTEIDKAIYASGRAEGFTDEQIAAEFAAIAARLVAEEKAEKLKS